MAMQHLRGLDLFATAPALSRQLPSTVSMASCLLDSPPGNAASGVTCAAKLYRLPPAMACARRVSGERVAAAPSQPPICRCMSLR